MKMHHFFMLMLALVCASGAYAEQMNTADVAALEQHMTTEGIIPSKEKIVRKVVDKAIDHVDKKIGGHGGDVSVTGNPCADEILPLCGYELTIESDDAMIAGVKECMALANRNEELSDACDDYMDPTVLRQTIELAKKSWALYHRVIGFKSAVIKKIKSAVIDKLLEAVGLDDEVAALQKIIADGKKELKDNVKGHVRVIKAKIKNMFGKDVNDAVMVGGHVVDSEGNVIDGAHVDDEGKIVNNEGAVIEGAKKVGDHIIDAAGNVIDGVAVVTYKIVDGIGHVVRGARILHGRIVDSDGNFLDKFKLVAGKIVDNITGFLPKVWKHMTKGTRACKADKQRLCSEYFGSRRKMKQCFETHWELGDLSTLCTKLLDGRKAREERERRHF
jgi:hypothetical protein